MDNYRIEMVPIDDIIPYPNNQKYHTPEQVQMIANSIRQFGFRQNLVIDKNNTIVIGHGRYEAAKICGMTEVPCMRIEDLSSEQIKALRIVDNKLNESAWDFDKLDIEIEELKDTIDLGDFGFEFDDAFSLDDIEENNSTENPKADNDRSMQNDAFENQEIMQFQILNYYGIPEIQPTQTTGNKFLRFMDWKEIEDYENYIAHFYYDDYKFMSAWREPYKFVDRLKKFKAVIAPDFSLYTDFPRALQILSCYRRNWCAAYWQSLGIDVIPDVVWGDKESYDFCFEGIPKRSTVAVSSVGVKRDKQWNNRENSLFVSGYNEMMNRLEPTAILYYGDMIDGLEGNIIRVPSFYEQKREQLNERRVAKKNGQRA